jgi:methionine synthase I (cobalamin-dependent)
MPNAGIPKREGDRIVWKIIARIFRAVAREAAALGVRILGGCCGITRVLTRWPTPSNHPS